jgi:hypothetical protein
MIAFLKFVGIGAASVVGLVVLGLSCVVLLFFPEWVRWTAGGFTVALLLWFLFFGRFRRKSGLLINDGTIYDRWQPRTKARKDFL